MRIALLTPSARYPEPWETGAETLATVLADGGRHDVAPWPWYETLPDGVDLIVPLYAWGYHRDPARWTAQMDDWDRRGLRVANPVALLRWNADKAYLRDIASKGARIVPTRWVDALSPADLVDAAVQFGTDQLIIKPPVSAGSVGTYRIAVGDTIPDDVAGQAMMIQPFCPAILGEGELSLFYFGGTYSHAIVKRAAADDFRVQGQFGGTDHAWPAPDGARRAAQAALQAVVACGHAMPLYARVDLVAYDGAYALMELEMIEPALFLHHAADGGAGLAASLTL